ncbi:hypothetical protein O6H91_05G007700 [Diphasiastrum complanatum]|nr:hypothetical protein O6H91_15G073800 [Diphasiastrum complanatum]KAJ7554755.1 hypothetical protein O6H91_05G007700 [Diphasiastrum complanatum]
MHTAVTFYGTVILLDRTDIGASNINLPNGACRNDPSDLRLPHDCTAHSVLYDPATNSLRPLTILTDTWCSAGSFLANGTLMQTGGDFDGNNKIRYFSPCPATGSCDWVEATDQFLQNGRWYASNQLLPDGRVIIVGGREVFNVEYIPAAPGEGTFSLPFLSQTHDQEIDNLYPYVHLIPDGNLYIFANRDSILYNYKSNQVIRTYPSIPGEPRNYPSAGSSVMMPLSGSNGYSVAEVLICGGSQFGAFLNPPAQLPASNTCGRITVTDPSASWSMEIMPSPRNMGDMILLPSRDVLLINGAQAGSQGFGLAELPCFNPVLYQPSAGEGLRFMVLTPTTIARMYHSTANLLPDGRILVAGSNPHYYYTFTGDFPTELRLEAFSPEYLSPGLASLRPTIIGAPTSLFYNVEFTITITTPSPITAAIELNLLSTPFTTHSYSQGQRLLQLTALNSVPLGDNTYTVSGIAPPNSIIAPSAYYMLFAVNQGIPSIAVWVQIRG